VGDSQRLSQYYPTLGMPVFDWIRSQAPAMNTQLVALMGDSVNVSSNMDQWWWSGKFVDQLASLPQVICAGNHDYEPPGPTSRDLENWWPTYPTSHYLRQSWFNGGFYEEGRAESGWWTATIGGQDWMFLWLECEPRAEVIAWAAALVESHPTYRVGVITHSYMDAAHTRYTTGDELWAGLLKLYENVVFLLCGHAGGGTSRRSDVGDHGNTVHQLMFDYETDTEGFEANNTYVRVLRFVPGAGKIYAETYSPYVGGWMTEAKNEFTLDYA
jgi:hypothetical protein